LIAFSHFFSVSFMQHEQTQLLLLLFDNWRKKKFWWAQRSRARRGFSCSPNCSSLAVVKKSRFRFSNIAPVFRENHLCAGFALRFYIFSFLCSHPHAGEAWEFFFCNLQSHAEQQQCSHIVYDEEFLHFRICVSPVNFFFVILSPRFLVPLLLPLKWKTILSFSHSSRYILVLSLSFKENVRGENERLNVRNGKSLKAWIVSRYM
jgi:hypothetical protein